MDICGVLRRAALAAVVALAIAAAAIQPAQAASSTCPATSLSHPFLPWLDLASYTLAPNGGLESGASNWTLGGGAGVVAGNEPYQVGSAADSSSLALPSGSSATTSTSCVSLLDPTVRFFAKGPLLGTLRVDALYTDVLGVQHAQAVGLVTGVGSWQPSLPFLFLANLSALPLVTNGQVAISFRFTPLGGNWRIDDVYVDPLKGS